MRDINEPVRVAYTAALTQIEGMDVFYQGLPDMLNPDNYIVFRSLNNTDTSSKQSAVVDLNITIEIHTKATKGNPGLNADVIADQVFQLVYPNKQTNLTLSRGQIIWTRVANDRTENITLRNQFSYIDRFITFSHRIVTDVEGVPGGGSMTTQGQLFRLEYTGVAGEVGFTDPNLINKRVLLVSKDGIEFSPILTSGVPTDKQVVYDAEEGSLLFDIPIEPGEEVMVIYQLNNQFQTLVYEYTASGGETSFQATALANKMVYGVSRDGVSASKIIWTGDPVDKQVRYDADGTITFPSALDAGVEIKVMYQLN